MTRGAANVTEHKLHHEMKGHPDMATHVQHEIGNPTRLIPTDRRRINSAPVGAASIRTMLAPSPLNLHAPQHYPHHPGFLESARMEREMAREMHQSSQRRSQNSAMSITTALANMSTQRFFAFVAGVLLLMVGLLALRFPVFLSDFDQWGFQINCGSGFQSNLTQAGIADSAGTHFIDQCHRAITMRRAGAIPLAVAGALLLSALLVRPSRQHSANAKTAGETPSALLSGLSPSTSRRGLAESCGASAVPSNRAVVVSAAPANHRGKMHLGVPRTDGLGDGRHASTMPTQARPTRPAGRSFTGIMDTFASVAEYRRKSAILKDLAGEAGRDKKQITRAVH